MDYVEKIIRKIAGSPHKEEFLRFKRMFSYELREFFARFKGEKCIPQSTLSAFLRARAYGTFHVIYDHGKEFHVMSNFNTGKWNLREFLEVVRPEFKLGAPR